MIDAKVVVEVSAYQGKLHTKFEEICVNRFWDMSEQTFVLFSQFFSFFIYLLINLLSFYQMDGYNTKGKPV